MKSMFEKVSEEYPVIAWFSGGITSAVACRVAIDLFGLDRIRVVFIDTMNEDEDTYRFLSECEAWYGKKIERITAISPDGKYKSIEDVWDEYSSLNVAQGAICSDRLKRAVRLKFQKENKYSFQTHGFDITEGKRCIGMSLNYADSNPIYPLAFMGLRKVDCLKMARSVGIEPPRSYAMGFHNNNCLKTGCVQGGVGYWQKMDRERPELVERMAEREHRYSRIKGRPVTMLKDQGKDGGYVFLRHNPDFPGVKDISMMSGREPKPLLECNGFCGLDDLGGANRDAVEEINFED